MSVGFSEEEADYVRKLHTGHTNQLRLLHYPQEVGQHEDKSRLGAHTDGRYACSQNLGPISWIRSHNGTAALLPSSSKTLIKVSSS